MSPNKKVDSKIVDGPLALESRVYNLNQNVANRPDHFYIFILSTVYGFISLIGTREGIESQTKFGFFPDVNTPDSNRSLTFLKHLVFVEFSRTSFFGFLC